MNGKIKHFLLVGSGKGGVGKSTVASLLALAFKRQGLKVGLLDADIYGPSLPTLLGGERAQSLDGKHIQPIERFGLKIMSMGYLVDPEKPIIWRGPMLAGAVTQFVNDVDWGELDILVCDLPPGTGDVQLSLSQKFQVTGALLVSTPQTVALVDVVRAKGMFDEVKIPVLGLIENMSYFICDGCDKKHEIFDSGGGESAANHLKIPFLGRIPLEQVVRQAGDLAQNLFEQAPESASSKSFLQLAQVVMGQVEAAEKIRIERAKKASASKSRLPIVQSA